MVHDRSQPPLSFIFLSATNSVDFDLTSRSEGCGVKLKGLVWLSRAWKTSRIKCLSWIWCVPKEAD